MGSRSMGTVKVLGGAPDKGALVIAVSSGGAASAGSTNAVWGAAVRSDSHRCRSWADRQ
ncbi:MAG: hypothetical protein Fur0021_23710 [Candidatus Promineifilaceae bacterium]